MAARKPLSIQSKMTGIIFLVSMVVLILTSLQFMWFELRRMQTFVEEDLTSLAQVISSNAALPMVLHDSVRVQQILRSLGARKDVVSAHLLLPNGRSIASYPDSKQPQSPTEASRLLKMLQLESRQIQEGIQLGAEMTWGALGRISNLMPVVYEGRLVGYSYISFETTSLRKEKLYLALTWLLSVGVAILVTYLLSTRLQRYISVPIEQLASQMKRISHEKRLTGGAHLESDDEFGVLYKGFEEMVKTLKERDQMLEQQRKNLELEVQIRTRALEAEKEKAEQATLAKSQFLANMSHEIRTPMIGVLGMSELLRNRPLDSQDKHLVETICNSGEALLEIINDILDFSKIEAGQLKLEVAPVDLKLLAEYVMQSMAVSAQVKGLVLKTEFPDEVPAVVGDAGRIRQILLNLVGNAIKFTDSGTVAMSLSTTVDETAQACDCMFVVQDTGIGIEEDLQSRIFDSFDQGDRSTTRKYGGTGLGLSITRELVHAMGGMIELESELGVGSTFRVFLPLSLDDRLDQSPEVHAAPVLSAEPHAKVTTTTSFGESYSGLRILLAEDNPTTQSLISILLEQMGFDLTIVDNGRAAVEFLEREPVDLVLMDCQMPEMDGFKATSHLRAAGLDTPIIALTAYARSEDEEQCLASGMNDFLSKPFRQSEMRDMLQKWLPSFPGEIKEMSAFLN